MPVTAGTQNKQWIIKPQHPKVPKLAKSLKVSPLLAQVLINRNVTEVGTGSAFLSPKLTELLKPELMPGIAPAIERIRKALDKKEKITSRKERNMP